MKIKLGVVGFSVGNGHPISWSIACNGYSKINLKKIPFKRILEYLPKYDLNCCKINDAEVSHIWTQDQKYSKFIAKVCKIKNICKSIDELTSSVDAILFLRDDIDTREKYLYEIIKSGKPIYVDKYLHYDPKKVSNILNKQKFKGQIFSESPLVNNKKIIFNQNELKSLGKIKLINSVVSGSWKQYSIHIIEPALRFLKYKNIKKINNIKTKSINSVTINFNDDTVVMFTTIKDADFTPFTELTGSLSSVRINWDFDYVFDDFLTTLRRFINIVRNKKFLIKNNHHIFLAKIINSAIKKSRN